jgi:hypothetical protein
MIFAIGINSKVPTEKIENIGWKKSKIAVGKN